VGELAGRLAVARTIVAEFGRQAPEPDGWPLRLHTALAALIAALDAQAAAGLAGAVTLTAADAETVRAALADAIDYRSVPAGSWCPDCGKRPDGELCADHAEDVGQADRYTALARSIGGGL
jgi:hypothetical protein